MLAQKIARKSAGTFVKLFIIPRAQLALIYTPTPCTNLCNSKQEKLKLPKVLGLIPILFYVGCNNTMIQ
jgi:hypothetical protein